jgi:hypothetical protein
MAWKLFISLAGFLWVTALAGAAETKPTLRIDPCSMKVAGGKAALAIGTLRRTNDIYTGGFQMKVAPWFFKNEKGRLAMVVTDEMISKGAKGESVEITGTATADGKDKVVRTITAVANPIDKDHGKLNLWFIVDERKMIFETSYRFVPE